MTTIDKTGRLLFLGGAGLPGWIWDGVRTELEPERDTSVGSRPSTNDYGPHDYAKQVLADSAAAPTTIVAHSIGVAVALAMHELAPERIDGLIAVAGIVPNPGRSFIESLPFPNRIVLRVATRVAGTKPPPSAIRKSLGAGLTDAVTERLVDDFAAEPRSLFLDPVPYRSVPSPRGYIFTESDREISPKLQSRYASNLDSRWTTTLSSGHLPMLERTTELADAIRRFLSDMSPQPC